MSVRLLCALSHQASTQGQRLQQSALCQLQSSCNADSDSMPHMLRCGTASGCGSQTPLHISNKEGSGLECCECVSQACATMAGRCSLALLYSAFASMSAHACQHIGSASEAAPPTCCHGVPCGAIRMQMPCERWHAPELAQMSESFMMACCAVSTTASLPTSSRNGVRTLNTRSTCMLAVSTAA